MQLPSTAFFCQSGSFLAFSLAALYVPILNVALLNFVLFVSETGDTESTVRDQIVRMFCLIVFICRMYFCFFLVLFFCFVSVRFAVLGSHALRSALH